jgi:hypothetical protein
VTTIVVLCLILAICGRVLKVAMDRGRADRDDAVGPGEPAPLSFFEDDGSSAPLSADVPDVAPLTASAHRPARVPAPTRLKDPTAGLRELQTLLDQGVISQAEYAERRNAIIDAI